MRRRKTGRCCAPNGLLRDSSPSNQAGIRAMLMSTDRILVSHVGSLPRSERLTDLLIRQEAGETIDTAELAREVETATAHAANRSKPVLT
jgi:hypothetical protein